MIVYDGLKTDFLSSCERDSIAIEIEENILAKMGKHTPKAEFRSWENSLDYMYKVPECIRKPDAMWHIPCYAMNLTGLMQSPGCSITLARIR